jgi:hypothetical protein
VTETTAPNSTEPIKKAPIKSVANLFQTKWINVNLIFFLYVALLAIVYTAYGHWTDKTLRRISDAKKEIELLEYDYKSKKIETSKVNHQDQIVKDVAPMGLTISESSPNILKK